MKAPTEILLDTGPLIGLLRGNELGKAVDQQHDLRARSIRPLISIGACAAATGALLLTCDSHFSYLEGFLSFQKFDPRSGTPDHG